MTPSREDLLERLKAATGPDRELDAALCIALKDFPIINISWTGGPARTDLNEGWYPTRNGYVEHPRWVSSLTGLPIGSQSKHYTSSLDAALALVERVLPGWVIEMCLDAKGGSAAIAPLWWNPRYDEDATDMKGAHETAPTLPLAVLTALLSALPADSLGQEETGK